MAKKVKKESTCVLKYTKDLTIQSAKKIHKEFQKAIKESSSIDVVVENVEAIDLTFVQLLHSLRNTAKKNNKTISFNITNNEDSELLLKNAGLANLF